MDDIKIEIDKSIKELEMWVDSIYFSEEEGMKTLNVVIDSDDVIDVNKITEASRIINPIVDEFDLCSDSYVLDIYSKEKGGKEDE